MVPQVEGEFALGGRCEHLCIPFLQAPWEAWSASVIWSLLSFPEAALTLPIHLVQAPLHELKLVIGHLTISTFTGTGPT